MSGFGERLRETRKSKNYTQKKLAESLKVAQSTIANYENNFRFPGSDTLRDISDYLGVSVDYLLGIETKNKKMQPQEIIDFENAPTQLVEKLIEGRIEEAKNLIKDINKLDISTTKIVEKIFIPSLNLIGEKWEKNELCIAEEHYATELIDKLFAYVSESREVSPKTEFTVVFMAPEGEDHLINLKMSTEYFKLRGWNIRFIGKSVPADNLIRIIKKDNVDLIVMSSLSHRGINSASYVISFLKSILKENMPLVLIGGNEVISENKDLIQSFANYCADDFSLLNSLIEKIEKRLRKKQIYN